MSELQRSLQIHFAVLSALGGSLLAVGEVGFGLPATAVLAATLSHLLVDRWRWFALPTSAAYVGMGLAAAICMTDFVWLDTGHQLVAVARLLVWVQAVLLFQRKRVRVFEQIGVFCLLELIVAAVFNSALLFGLLLIPFSLVGLRSLVLLHALATADASSDHDDGRIRTGPGTESLAAPNRHPPRGAIMLATPSVVLLACMIFYGLPRTDGAGDGGGRIGGSVTTGFSEVLKLDQVGSLQSDPQLVMRMTLFDNRMVTRYRSSQSIYLRGQTLENYHAASRTGTWSSAMVRPYQSGNLLPEAFVPNEAAERAMVDDVQVEIELQPLTSESLFVIAPYHTLYKDAEMVHVSGKWILERHDSTRLGGPGRFAYRFGTSAFHQGVQTRFVRYFAPHEGRERNVVGRGVRSVEVASRSFDAELYQRMLRFDSGRMPSVAAEAQRVAASFGDGADSQYALALAIEHHLALTGGFSYTTDLNEERDPAVDPIEEFVAQYRRGHCQYFASAMVMMLRSQGIPARLVAGYRTEEFNPIGQHYVVRQSHAHVWVEALLDDRDLSPSSHLIGQPADGPVLVRFDPTPGREEPQTGQAVVFGQFYDFAQLLWNSYVLDMSSSRQAETMFARDDTSGASRAYARLLEQARASASHVADGMGTGAALGRGLFSWRAAVASIAAALILSGLYQIGVPWPGRIGRRPGSSQAVGLASSSVVFYTRMCELLASRGVHRRSGATPLEFIDVAVRQFPATDGHSRQAMSNIVYHFYRRRFGGYDVATQEEEASIQGSLDQIEMLVHRAEADSTTGTSKSEA